MDKTNLILSIFALCCICLALGLGAGYLWGEHDNQVNHDEAYTIGFKDGLSRSVDAAMHANVRSREFALELVAIADSIMNPETAIGYNYPGAPRNGQRVVTPNGSGRDYGIPDTGSWMDSLYREDSKK